MRQSVMACLLSTLLAASAIADVIPSDPDLPYIPPESEPKPARCGEGVALSFVLIAVGLFARKLFHARKRMVIDSSYQHSH